MTTEQKVNILKELSWTKTLSNLSGKHDGDLPSQCQSNRCAQQPGNAVITPPNWELDVSDVAVGDRLKRSLTTRAYWALSVAFLDATSACSAFSRAWTRLEQSAEQRLYDDFD